MTEEENYADKLEQLAKDKEILEQEFGVKRAQFIELFKQKEDEFKKLENTLSGVHEEKASLQTEYDNLKAELDGIKTATAIAESSRQDEMVAIQRQYAEETASMQHLIKEAASQAHQELDQKYHIEFQTLQKSNDGLNAELQEAKKKLSQERESFIDSIAKSLHKKVGNPLGGSSTEDENLEESMKKAQEDAEILKSVVMPLEEEIMSLKEQLHIANTKLRETIINATAKEASSTPDNSSDNEDEKVKELSKNLKTEKSSRSDLELYVAVLSAQKTAIQDEAEKQKSQLQDIMRLLEVEKREHTDLRNTWQLANDQFLESQRLMLMDMRNMESLLSEEQQRQLDELKRLDEQRVEQERKVKELEEKRQKSEEEAKHVGETDNSESSGSKSKGSMTSLVLDDYLKFEGEEESLITRSQSSQSLSSRDLRDRGFVDSGVHETKSLNEEPVGDIGEKHSHVLTEEQQKAIACSTLELKIDESILASVKAKTEGFSMEGKKLVSQHEWNMMEKELRNSRDRLGKPCDMCKNYEAQLQQIQSVEKDAQAKVRTAERQLEMERSTIKSIKAYTEKLEVSLKTTCLEAQSQISQLYERNKFTEESLRKIKQEMSESTDDLDKDFSKLRQERDEVYKELRHLEEENDKLIGKHSKHSQQIQEETINLPENLEDMQLLLLTYREDVIASKVAREHQEETLRSEIMFIKSQLFGEQQERNKMEEALSNEISQLQEDLAILQSVKSEHDRQTKLKNEAEHKLKEAESSLKSIQAKSKQLIQALQSQVEEHTTARTKLESQLYEQKVKIHGLQLDLDNSEAVQRDFVKLSQSLQIQLEKIRAGEHEVRWQYDDDADDCTNCKKRFEGIKGKKKVLIKDHCLHCGKIFCPDCLNKTVASGPKRRPSKVCDVCHTILVRDATPYFSTEAPQTPD